MVYFEHKCALETSSHVIGSFAQRSLAHDLHVFNRQFLNSKRNVLPPPMAGSSVVRTHDEETARLQEVVRDTLIHRLDTPVLTEAFDASHLGPVLPVFELRRLWMRHELHTLGKFTVKSRVMYLLNGAQVERPGAECVTL